MGAGQIGRPPLLVPSFLTRFFIHSTSREKVVFFAARSVQGFQKPYYFPMNQHTQFWVWVATVSVGRDVLAFFDSYIWDKEKSGIPPPTKHCRTPVRICGGQLIRKKGAFLNDLSCPPTKNTVFPSVLTSTWCRWQNDQKKKHTPF